MGAKTTVGFRGRNSEMGRDEPLIAEMESMGQGLDGQNGRPCIGICFLR